MGEKLEGEGEEEQRRLGYKETVATRGSIQLGAHKYVKTRLLCTDRAMLVCRGRLTVRNANAKSINTRRPGERQCGGSGRSAVGL